MNCQVHACAWSMEHGAKSHGSWLGPRGPFFSTTWRGARIVPKGIRLWIFFLTPVLKLASSLIDCSIEDFICQYHFDEIDCRVEYYCPGSHLLERCRGLVLIKRAPSGDGWTPHPNPAIKLNTDIASRHVWLWWLTEERLHCRERLANKTKIGSPFE